MSTATVNATLDAAADDVLAAPITAPEHEDDRPGGQAVFAAFCYEDPDSFIGRYVSQTLADLAENGTTVYLFARRHFPGDEPGVRTHAVGDCDGDDLLGSVREFTRRAANAFLRQFRAKTEGVTLLGYEWSAVPTLSLLHALCDLPTVASFHSLEWERSDMSSETSWQIAEIELAGLRKARTILVHQASTAKIARRRLPECAGRIVAAQEFFTCGGPRLITEIEEGLARDLLGEEAEPRLASPRKRVEVPEVEVADHGSSGSSGDTIPGSSGDTIPNSEKLGMVSVELLVSPELQAACPRPALALSRADERAIDVVIDLLRPARRLLFITGAGLSAESGVPTYRGRDGLYSRDGLFSRDGVYRDGLTTPHGMTIEQALSGPMLASRPEITWHYLRELERFARGGVPNRGHRVIAEMESYFDAVWTVTQNVDGLHLRAGSRQVLDVHGDLHDLLCTQCDYKVTVPDYADLALPPLCPRCQGILRPTVVLFGEPVPEEKLARLWFKFGVGFDMVFSVGTSSLLEYIALPVELARALGIATVEINPETTTVTSGVEVKISGGAAPVLDLIWQRYMVGWPWW